MVSPVTDPNLLSQLEGGDSGSQPVTDPNLLSQLEGQQQEQPQKSFSWSKTAQNAGKDFMGMPGVPQTMMRVAQGEPLGSTPLGQTAQSIFKIGRGMMPDAPVQTGVQMAQGKPFSETPVGQAAGEVWNTAKQVPRTIFNMGKDVGSAVAFVPQVVSGTPAGQTYAAQRFQERPLNYAMNVGTAGAVGAGIAKSIFGNNNPESSVSPESQNNVSPAGNEPPNKLETMGSGNLNRMAGIRSGTVNRLTPMSENPVDTGIEIQKRMISDNATGDNAAEILPKAVKASQKWNKEIGDAWDDIKTANANNSQGTPFYDKLQVNSAPTLKPILDEANDLINSGYDPETGAKMKSMYQNLQNAANENGGQLTVDAVDTEMSRVGKLFKNAARDSDKFAQAKELWSKLADIREGMVNDVADASGNPELASRLKTANRAATIYHRVMPDLRAAASQIATGQESMTGFMDYLKKRVIRGPEASQAMMRAGSAGKGMSGAISSGLNKLTPAVALDLLKEAKGDKDLARKLADERGYDRTGQ